MPGSFASSIIELKSGVVAAGSFTGSPRKYTVTFASLGMTNFADSDYAIHITGIDARSWSYESVTASGFIINTRSATALTGTVSWTASKTGER
jgi:hypothetical protein